MASYTITKNSAVGTTGNIIKWLPPHVSIASTGTTCATHLNTAFTLGNDESCILNLTVSGVVSKNDPNPEHHLMVCLSDRASCAGPDPRNSLNVTADTAVYTTVGRYVNDLGVTVPLAYRSTDGGQRWSVSTTLPRQHKEPVPYSVVWLVVAVGCGVPLLVPLLMAAEQEFL